MTHYQMLADAQRKDAEIARLRECIQEMEQVAIPGLHIYYAEQIALLNSTIADLRAGSLSSEGRGSPIFDPRRVLPPISGTRSGNN